MNQTNLLTVQEVADLLKIKKNTVYELIKRGELPSKKVGKQLRIAETDVDNYLKNGEGNTTEYSSEQVTKTSPVQQEALRERSSDKLILCGQDISLDIIANYVSSQPGMPLVLRSHMGSYNGLYSLYQGKAQIATCHLWDEKTGEYNYTYISKLIPGLPVIVVRLFGRKQGFYVQKGNPKNIRGWEDLLRTDLKFINRERGSGTRVLLDEKLKTLSARRSVIQGYDKEYTSHLSVANAITRGEGDFGLGSESGAMLREGLSFIPLQNEWYDMVFMAELENTLPYRAILDFICSNLFLQELISLGDYDISQTGRIKKL